MNITEAEDKYFIRFYDFIDNHIIFNILTFVKENQSKKTLISTEIYPGSSPKFLIGLKDVDINTIQLSSTLYLETFSEQNSKDIIVVGFMS